MIGNQLLSVFEQATCEIVIAAPFIKKEPLKRLITKVPQCVKITCITRWRLEELAQGVSDLEIWNVLSNRLKASLLLIPNLHAKYYRSDRRCLIGSANVTLTALEWAPNPNLELLIELPFESCRLQCFERQLRELAVPVDEAIYQWTRTLLDEVRDQYPQSSGISIHDATFTGNLYQKVWYPQYRYPETLYQVYQGIKDCVPREAYDIALSELAQLGVPAGLTQKAFEKWIGLALLQQPIVRAVDAYLDQPRRFGFMALRVAEFLKQHDIRLENYKGVWQALMRWLLYFLPQRYRYSRPRYSEIVCKTDGALENKQH